MLDQLREKLETLELDAFWISKPENVRYLSGFTTPDDAKVLVTKNRAVLYTDARYAVQAEQESRVPVHVARFEEVYQHAKPIVQGMRIGFESDAVLYEGFEELTNGLGADLKAVKGLIDDMRLIKTFDEIEAIRRAAIIADAALEALLPKLQPGVTERDFALELEFEMRRRGADGAAFEIIVASGERSAMPHGVASDKVIQNGDLVTIDWGARLNGYHSDCTRVYPVGEISSQLEDLYRAVLEANERGMAAVRPGARCKAVDAIARDYLKSVGFDKEFAHSLGHGVGLAVHELPKLSYRAEEAEVLQEGMIVTVEPGVYLAGVGGARVEDLVVVTANGCEALTKLPKYKP
jgi:Xaa-Pro aminopeptidase